MIKGIYGFNVAVKDLAEATRRYESVFGVTAKPLGGTDFAFPGLTGSQLIINGLVVNLVTSSQPDTSVAKFLERKGEGVFLISMEADSIGEDVATLRQKGLEVVLPESATGEFGAVNFVHPRSMNGVQFEIIQPAS